MQFLGGNREVLMLHHVTGKADAALSAPLPSGLTLIWFKEKQEVRIDGQPYAIKANQVLCLTEFHHIESGQYDSARFIRFNRSFYCIKDHDDEVSCKGLLFYSASQPPIITIPRAEEEKFELLWKMFSLEMATADNLQFEMLQMMLKRLIILCTRLYKKQHELLDVKTDHIDLLREFNFLVELHFRQHHNVAAYAALLHKSPKTLANLFAKQGGRPLQIIQDRIMLEARRLLRYTDKPVKEIAYGLGYDDIQAFSRAFRQNEGLTPSDFRVNKELGSRHAVKGSIAN